MKDDIIKMVALEIISLVSRYLRVERIFQKNVNRAFEPLAIQTHDLSVKQINANRTP